jgi:hypothetical protein
MGFNTKINLNSDKIIQCSGEILNLSGCTNIFGALELASGTTLSILANAGVGKVLTSDITGGTTWQNPTGGGTITGGTNGLGITSKNVCLGGRLNSGSTAITLPNNTIFSIGAGNPANFFGGRIDLNRCDTVSYENYLTLGAKNGSISTITIIPTGITIFGNDSGFKGMQYCADYSVNYQCLSLVNAGWVTGNTGGGTITGSTNGLSVSGKNIGLGGVLTGNTSITGAHTLNICGGASLNTRDGYQQSGSTILKTKGASTPSVYIGVAAGPATSNAVKNVGVGNNIMYYLSTGTNNIGIGSAVLSNNPNTGSYNIGLGTTVMICLTTGCFNIAMGCASMAGSPATPITGNDNIAVGHNSLSCISTGCNNVALGCYAGSNITSGCNNILIGTGAGGALTTVSNQLYIGSVTNPLIYGDFSTKCIIINGQLAITGITSCNTAKTALIWDSGTSVVHGYPIIEEWVSSISGLTYAGQKFAYSTQIIMQVDVGTCVTMPNYIQISNINLKCVGDTPIFTIPSGKAALFNRAKLIILNDATPTCFSVSIGNNECYIGNCSNNNLANLQQISDVLTNETYEMTLNTKGVPESCGSILYFRVGSGSTSACNLCAHLLVEGFIY